MKPHGENTTAAAALSATSGVFDAAMEIARQRREILVQLRAALEAGDQPNINRFARELCGLSNETSNRVN
jgi:hypothetical protein